MPPAFRESVLVGEQNLYAQGGALIGHRDPRSHGYSMQLRSFDADRSGAKLGLPILVACAGGLLERSIRGGLIIVGPLNLGGSVELVPDAVALAELAMDKQATTLLMPVAARRALNDLPDEVWTKLRIELYRDAADGVFKALLDRGRCLSFRIFAVAANVARIHTTSGEDGWSGSGLRKNQCLTPPRPRLPAPARAVRTSVRTEHRSPSRRSDSGPGQAHGPDTLATHGPVPNEDMLHHGTH